MVRNALGALCAEPRPPHPPVRVWRDWALVAVLVSWSVVETVLRQDLAWRPVVLTIGVVVALTLLWRRTHPLAAVTVAFGALTAVDVARILAADETGLLWSIAAALLLPYSLFRWGAGREAAIGLGVILAWLAVTHVADPTGAVEVVAGYGFFLFSAALGTSIRYHANARIRDIEQAKLRQRNQLARELHDTVGHHVSAIAIQAQAGRALAASHPDRALATLETIEERRRGRSRRCAPWSGSCATGRSPTSPRNRAWQTSNDSPAASGGGPASTCSCPVTSTTSTPPWGSPSPDRPGNGHQRGAPRPPRHPGHRPRRRRG